MSNKFYNHQQIEAKWQAYWSKNNFFQADLTSKKPKFYVLDMFPYPSGAGLHVGHPEGYTATDIIARMKRMQGYEVLHPIGFDAFGLPAEQYAIKTGNEPEAFTKTNIANFKSQLLKLGFSFDWSRELSTTDENYYKHTQWIFAQLYRNNLAIIKNVEVNFSPSLNTVLANEEVIVNKDNQLVSERDGLLVIKKTLPHWILKITDYAPQLFAGLDDLDWPDSIKKLQRNWIYYQNTDGSYSKKLHLQDWVFARQRYWGEPFPIVHLKDGSTFLIPESDYPIKLPKLTNYSFKTDGKPALANATDWIKYNDHNVEGIRDLNTMPQWAGSSWYYIAYLLRKTDGTFYDLNSKEAKKILDKWLPVDLYIGGQEHAVLHLLYARFWHHFLVDLGITKIKEPFKNLQNQGMILGADNNKMSKSKGNIVNPDAIIIKYGADALRLYEMFIGPLHEDKPWTDSGIESSRKWLERVNRFYLEIWVNGEPSLITKQKFNQLIAKVTTNFLDLKFNLAISELMIFLNHLYKNPIADKTILTGFCQLLSCIAPHLPEELNSIVLKQKGSISLIDWPVGFADVKEIKTQPLIVQIDGKFKGIINDYQLSSSPDNEELLALLLKHNLSPKSRRAIRKIIYIDKKIINIVY